MSSSTRVEYNAMAPEIENDPAFEEFITTEDGEPALKVNTSGFRTIELRDPEPFEDDLLVEVTGPIDERGGIGASIPVKGKWIHGWLESRGEDYINNIYKNWLHFTTYVKARTRQFINTEEFNIRQGSYENMYRYILVLEDLDLVTRGRTEDVPLEEYDHFVPERMRSRRYVTIETPFAEAQDAWTSPHDALYGGETDEEEDEGIDIPIDTEDEEGDEPTGGSIDAFTPEEDEGGRTTQGGGGGSIDDFTPTEETDVEFEETSIDDYPRIDEMRETVIDQFGSAAEDALGTADVDYEDVIPTDFALANFVVVGVWATGEAEPQRDTLDVVMSVDDSLASLNPGFLPGAIGSQYRSIILNNFDDWFTDVSITSVYDDGFDDTLALSLAGQEPKIYYDVLSTSFKDGSEE